MPCQRECISCSERLVGADEDYRGNVGVILFNHSDVAFDSKLFVHASVRLYVTDSCCLRALMKLVCVL